LRDAETGAGAMMEIAKPGWKKLLKPKWFGQVRRLGRRSDDTPEPRFRSRPAFLIRKGRRTRLQQSRVQQVPHTISSCQRVGLFGFGCLHARNCAPCQFVWTFPCKLMTESPKLSHTVMTTWDLQFQEPCASYEPSPATQKFLSKKESKGRFSLRPRTVHTGWDITMGHPSC